MVTGTGSEFGERCDGARHLLLGLHKDDGERRKAATSNACRDATSEASRAIVRRQREAELPM